MTAATAVLGTVLGLFVVAGALVYDAGAVRVDVREKGRTGKHIHLLVPAIALPVAVRLIPKNKLNNAPDEIRPWLPTIKAAGEELARCPDGLLVEVDSHRDHVRVNKQNRSLFVDVDSEDATVQVSFPLQAAFDTLNALARDGGMNGVN